MEPGHKGPVPGAVRLFWLEVSLALFTRFTYQTPHPTASLLSALPLFLLARRRSEPSISPSFLQAPLLLHGVPDLGGQRDGGQGVDRVRCGGAPAEMDCGSGSDQLQQVSLDFSGRESGALAASTFLSDVLFLHPACAHVARPINTHICPH